MLPAPAVSCRDTVCPVSVGQLVHKSRPCRMGHLPESGSHMTEPSAHDTNRWQPAGGEEKPVVLVADDDPDTRAALRLVLEDAGYVVLEAADGVAALDALLLSSTSLVVLLDLLMPRMSGYEALLQVAADPVLAARHAYIILTASQLSDPRVGPRFAELVEHIGALVVAKPFDVDQLLDCVERHYRRRSAVHEDTPPGHGTQTG